MSTITIILLKAFWCLLVISTVLYIYDRVAKLDKTPTLKSIWVKRLTMAWLAFAFALWMAW